MAAAKTTAAAESKKKKPLVTTKAKLMEEVTILSSGESDFDDDDSDCVEVPGSPVSQQPGYKVICQPPGASPLRQAGLKQQTTNAMQQKTEKVIQVSFLFSQRYCYDECSIICTSVNVKINVLQATRIFFNSGYLTTILGIPCECCCCNKPSGTEENATAKCCQSTVTQRCH